MKLDLHRFDLCYQLRRKSRDYCIKVCVKDEIKYTKTFELLTGVWLIYYEQNTSSIVV